MNASWSRTTSAATESPYSRKAAGPTDLSGPGALAEHVARLRDLAGASAADLVGAVAARDALREIDAITSGG